MALGAAPQRPASAARLVGLYALAWLAYLTAYGAVLRAGMAVPPAFAVMGAVANGLPPAALGWWALRRGRRSASRFVGRVPFWSDHIAGAGAYAGFSMLGTWLFFFLFHRLESGSWDPFGVHLGPLLWQLLICSLLYTVLAGLGHTWALRERLQQEETRAARARELAARSQLEALRARLDPHFLFNTLHSLLALVRRDPNAAEEGIERLGDLLHFALRARGAEGDEVTLAEEADFVNGYVELERLRLAERLRFEMSLDPSARSCLLPAFTLQPLVENALRHAVAPRADGGRVKVTGQVHDAELVLEVADDGPGASDEDLADSGQGLELVRQRLRVLHGDRADLTIDTASDAGFRARVHLPARLPEEGAGR